MICSISCTFFFSLLISFLLLAPKPGPKRKIRKKKLRKNRNMIYVLKTKSSNCFALSLISTNAITFYYLVFFANETLVLLFYDCVQKIED